MVEQKSKQKLIIVSNRLPISVSKIDGELVFSNSSGGLATAMSSLEDSGMQRVWIGWPGISSDEITSSERRRITKKLSGLGCVPVYLTAQQVKNFYSGYANDTIWPLFHYFHNFTQHSSVYWSAYKEVNKIFGRIVIKNYDEHSLIWVHDYHLMLLPLMLRKALPRSIIGFFLHIPFPSYEVFRPLPNRSEILRGLMGADLVGFHIYDYSLHFLNSVERILGLDSKQGLITLEGRTVKTDAFPIGIDYEKFALAAKQNKVSDLAKTLGAHYKGQRVILSVDRLDYSKGILKRLEAFEHFIKNNPEYLKKVVLVMIAVPSREEVATYKDLRESIELTISRINGTYSTVDWSPISYQFKNLPFEEIVALYARSDIALVTPLRDGMNLVAKEYVASKNNKQGVLILSEMAGAIDEMHEAIRVNPNDVNSMVDAIKKALLMSKKEQSQRLTLMSERISEYTVQVWAKDFIDQLSKSKKSLSKPAARLLSANDLTSMKDAYHRAIWRLIFLDYDGTLSTFQVDYGSPQNAPSKTLLDALEKLSKKRGTNLYIISGRPYKTLEKWFGHLKINLVAEHGAWIKERGKWREGKILYRYEVMRLLPILERYRDRTPGARIEVKSSSLVWHYRRVPMELAYTRSEGLKRELNDNIDERKLGIYSGEKIVEVRPNHINKGKFVKRVLRLRPANFILCIGDDYTDEDMFRVMPKSAYSIKVGYQETDAKYQVYSPARVVRLLKSLADS